MKDEGIDEIFRHIIQIFSTKFSKSLKKES
jgi:hypothetical protein